jgi:hypothetical protein
MRAVGVAESQDREADHDQAGNDGQNNLRLSVAGQIEQLLLTQTPIIYAYFYNYLTATAMGVTGVYPTAIGHLFLYNAAKS